VLIVGNNKRQRYSYKKQEIRDDDDDDEQIAFNVAYSPATARTRNSKLYAISQTISICDDLERSFQLL